MLKENTFFGKRDKIKTAIQRLKIHEPKEGYYLAFGGGKDSITIKALADMAKVKYDAHFNLTTIDPPELVKFIKQYHSDVKIEMPEKPFVKAIVSHGFPMVHSRWCCEVYKECGGKNRFVLTGVRWAESHRRSKRQMTERCYKKGLNKVFLHPIIDWDDSDVWEFIKQKKLPYCKLYDEGWKRIGCVMCPCASVEQRQFEADKYPGYKKRFIKAFVELYEDRKSKGLESVKRWKSGDDMFYWWLSCNPKPRDSQQFVMFE
jgi:phosphoadenosine phosphosulfate reductase